MPDEEFSFLEKQPQVAGVKWCFKIFRSPWSPSILFASFTQNEIEELHKYIVIDAETKRELQSGKSYHHYDNSYKNNPPIGGLFYSGTLINFFHFTNKNNSTNGKEKGNSFCNKDVDCFRLVKCCEEIYECME